jgi:uncharacterized GH25 family protein
VPWHIAAALVALTFACLVLMQQTARLAVAVAGQILTPQERIEIIGELSQKYGSPEREYGESDKIEVSGVVRTWDSASLPADHRLMVPYIKHNGGGSLRIYKSKGGVFRDSIEYVNQFYMIVLAEGYAPAYAGPFQAEPGGRVEGIELMLGKGFPGRIQVVDESGQPVPEAKLTVGYVYPYSDSYEYAADLSTDASGLATLEHAAAVRVSMEIDAAGFELAHVGGFERGHVESFALDPERTRTVTLKRARPMTGVVLAATTSKPIAGAEIRVFASTGAGDVSSENFIWGKPNAITDAQGRFELPRLRQGRKHLLFVRASGYGYRYVPDVEAGNHDIKVALGPKKVIRGMITGDLSLLDTDPNSCQPIIQVANSYEYPRHSTSSAGANKAPVTIRGGVGYFEIEGFWGQIVTLWAGPEQVRLNVEKDRLDAITINLRPAAQRQVVLRFQVPPGGPPIKGTVQTEYHTTGTSQHNEGTNTKRLNIQDNQVSCTIPVPGGFTYGIDFINGQRPVGYWFAPTLVPIYIPPGGDPFVIDVPVHPAGAICGRILRPDGSMASDAHAKLITVRKSDVDSAQGFPFSSLGNVLSDGVDRGTYNATPLPLGGSYIVVAYEGYVLAQTDIFLLDEKTSIANQDLHLPRGIDVQGLLLGPDGAPAHSEVSLHIAVRQGGQLFWVVSGRPIKPDEDGRFVFRNVNPGPQGTCAIASPGPAGCRPIEYVIEDLGTPVTIRLEKGSRVTGMVVDNATGQPVSGIQVYACPAPASMYPFGYDPEMVPADEPTDKQGRFVFSRMAQQKYELGVVDAEFAGTTLPIVVTGGQVAPVVLRVQIPKGSDLKPREP